MMFPFLKAYYLGAEDNHPRRGVGWKRDCQPSNYPKKSRLYDSNGQTVGIITKPDIINTGTDRRISQLAKNQDTMKLKPGIFLVKNPTPRELDEGITSDQRQTNEVQYFRSSSWK
jgi:hypothetical protein